MPDPNQAPLRAGRLRGLLAVAVLAVLASAAAFLPLGEVLDGVSERVEALGPLGPIAFGLFYVVAALALVPGSAITLAVGALFGVVAGTVVVSLASTATAAIAFLLARTLLRSRVEGLARKSAAFRAVDEAIADGGWRIVGLLRLSPVVPFNALNYLLGLTAVPFVPAVLVSWIAMLPATVLFVYFGAIGRDVASGASRSPAEWALLGVGLAATLGVTVLLTRMARARLATTAIEEPTSDPA
ncbi:MAG: TVP38/TMEM64 family protein [Planctomycetota bacterium]|jgi:uncharacterized membrane protein YdjX (TVP38/TMEM64 family)